MTLTVRAPLAGRCIPLEQVPDPVFAQGMVGHGVAVEPGVQEGRITVVSPVAGRVIKVMPHAFVVHAPDAAVLVHLGIDTVKLEGDGFTVHVAKGDHVEAGEAVVDMDLDRVRRAGFSSCCPVVALDTSEEAIAPSAAQGDVATGAVLFTVTSREP